MRKKSAELKEISIVLRNLKCACGNWKPIQVQASSGVQSGSGVSMAESIFGGSSIATPGQLERMLGAIPRPFVVINDRELSVLRRGLTKDGWKRALYLAPVEQGQSAYMGYGLLSVANRWLESDISISNRGGRFDGAHHLHQQLAGAALSLALVYGIEKDRAYADKAIEILLEYARVYAEPHADNLTGGVLQKSFCEAVWAIPLAQAYDLICNPRTMRESERDAVEESLFMPIAGSLKQVDEHCDWRAWSVSAVGVIGMALKNAQLLHYALSSFETQLRERVGEDGLWPESIDSSHFHTLRAFIHLAEGCSRLGLNLYSHSAGPNRSLRAMFRAPLNYVYPSFRLPTINDGLYDAFVPLDLYEIAFRRWGDPSFAWVLKRGYRLSEIPASSDHKRFADLFERRSFYAFLFGRDLPGRVGSPVLNAQCSPSLGMCVLRNDRLMATLDYGPSLPNGHLDKLGFTLFADNELRIPDYGTPECGAGIADFYRGTAAHNTVMVDGRSQEPVCDNGLQYFHVGNAVQCVEAVAEDCYPGVTHVRQMVMLSDALIITDRLTGREKHTYDWLMHCDGVPEIEVDAEPCEFGLQPEPPIRVERSWSMPDCCRVNWRCERGGVALGLWFCGGEGIAALGTTPAETSRKTSSLLIGRQAGAEAVFLTVIVPLREGESVEMDKTGGVVRILRADGADYVYVRAADQSFVKDGLTTDAQLAVLQVRSGEICALGLVQGTRLMWGGESVIESTLPVKCLQVSFEQRSPMRYEGMEASIIKLRSSARSIRINGHRVATSVSDGQAVLRVTPVMLDAGGSTSF